MSSLEKAVEIAIQAHKGQFDKSGEPYILHPMRLASKFENTDLKIVALLHDVVEDSNFSLDDLVGFGFSENIVDAIDCLTKRVNEDYERFIVRASRNKYAIKVKIEDLKDNMNVCRLRQELSNKDLQRIAKYHKAYLMLSKLDKEL